MYLLVSVLLLEPHDCPDSDVLIVADLVMHCVKCRFSCAYAIGVQFLSFGTARSSMCCIPISVNTFCWCVVMPAKYSVMCHSSVGGSAISMPS